MLRRIISLLLAVTLVMGILPTAVLAEEITEEIPAETVTVITEPDKTASEESGTEPAVEVTTIPTETVTEPATVPTEETAAPTVEATEPVEEETTAPETVELENFFATEPASMVVTASRICGDTLTWEIENGVLTISGSGAMKNFAGNTNIPWYLNRDEIRSVVVEEGVTTIGNYAFYGLSISELTIPEGVTSVGADAFGYCTSLTSVTFPDSLTSIGSRAFSGCDILAELVIPKNVATIGTRVFNNCNQLKTVTFEGTAPAFAREAFLNNSFTAYYPGNDPAWAEAVTQSYGGYIKWTAQEVATVAEGTCGSNLTWILAENGILTISGTGDMTNWSGASSVPWYYNCDSIETVVIAEGITNIGDYAFYNCTGLTDVMIPDSVTQIGSDAFYGCAGLTEIVIPDSVISIGSFAFGCCTGLTEVIVPDSVISIGASAFYACGSLTEVIIPDGVTSIGVSAFEGCTGLTEVVIPDSVISIGDSAFRGCKGLTNVTIGSGVTSIGEYAFWGCSGLRVMYIPASVTTISASTYSSAPFYNCSYGLVLYCEAEAQPDDWGSYWNYCSNASELSVKWNTSREEGAFWAGDAQNAEVVIPDYVTSIPSRAFYDRIDLTSVTIGSGVTSIGDSAFYNCDGLETVYIPNSVTSVGKKAFFDCDGLHAVHIPASVTTISASTYSSAPFYNGSSGLVLYCEAESQPDGWGSCWNYFGSTSTLTVRWGMSQQESEFWSSEELQNAEVVIPDYVTSIPTEAFLNRTDLTSVTIPDSVTSIGSGAFINCTSLSTVFIPASVTSIPVPDYSHNAPFYGCASDLMIFCEAKVQPEGWESYWNAYQSGESSILTVSWGVSRQESEFWGSEEVKNAEVVIPDYVTSIPSRAFYDRADLISVTIPDSVTSIGSKAFYSCTGLSTVYIPESVTTISAPDYYDSPFYWCSPSLKIYCGASSCPSGWDSPWNNRHGGEYNNERLGAHYGYTRRDYGFWTTVDKSASVIEIPDGITMIPDFAFMDCSALTEISISSSVASIGVDAFFNCGNLQTITFAHLATDTLAIGVDAFYFYEPTNDLILKDTVIRVPYSRDIHTAISGYAWTESKRSVSYESTGYAPATKITLSGEPISAEAGQELQIPVELEPYYATSKLLWTVTPGTGDAVVDENGVLTGTVPGTVTVQVVSADDESVRDEIQVEFLEPTAKVSDIIITSDGEFAGDVEVGKSVQLHARVLPGNAANKKVIWSVSDGTGSATITEDGLLTGVTTGTVFVWATAMDENPYAESYEMQVARYVESMTLTVNGEENATSFGMGEIVRAEVRMFPEDTSCTNVTWELVDGDGIVRTGSMGVRFNIPYADIEGLEAGTFTLRAVAQDSRQVAVSRELSVVGEEASAQDKNGNTFYYNTETGVITGCDPYVSSLTIPAEVDGVTITAIGNDALKNGYLETVVLPNTITRIGTKAFHRNMGLKSINIPASVTEIGDQAFYWCQGLENVEFIGQSQLKTVGKEAFYWCSALKSLTIPESVTDVGLQAFTMLQGLKQLTMPGELDPTDRVGGFSNLETLTLTGSRVWGDEDADLYCRNAKNIILAPIITEIDPYAFKSSYNAVSITLPDNLKTIGEHAFENCWKVTDFILPDGLIYIGEEAFRDCSSAVFNGLPDSLTHIGKWAFQSCENAQLIDLSGMPDVIGEQKLCLNEVTSIPEILITATGGKVKPDWYLMDYNDTPCYDVVGMWGDGVNWYLVPKALGQVKLVCRDEYTGARSSKVISVEEGILIGAETYPGYLPSGKSLQLTATKMPGGTAASVTWSSSNTAYATVSSSGKVVAKPVENPVQVTISAKLKNSDKTVSKTLWIIPGNTPFRITTELETTSIDMAAVSTLSLAAAMEGIENTQNIQWRSSDYSVARVDNSGEVYLERPGTVTITATETYGASASMKLNVYYLDGAAKLTASAELPDIGLQPGETAVLTVSGKNPIAPEQLTYVSSNEDVAFVSIEEDAVRIIAVAPGKVNITAFLDGDPLGRSAKLALTVIPTQTGSVTLQPIEEDVILEMVDENGEVTNEPDQAAKYVVYVDKEKVASSAYTFALCPAALDTNGDAMEVTDSTFKWATSNSKVATVAANAEGMAVVTVKKKATGACVLTAVSNDLAKVTKEVELHVRDPKPRLQASSFTINTMRVDASVATVLYESYENRIIADAENPILLYEYNSKTKSYSETPSERLEAQWEENILTIRSLMPMAKGTLKLNMVVPCADKTYEFALKLTVKNSTPKLTVKQSGKLNRFYTDSTGILKLSAKGGIPIDSAELTGCDFIVTKEDGRFVLSYREGYNPILKPDAKGTLTVTIEGYHPVTKAVTISTTSTAPKLTTTPSSAVLNIAMGESSTTFRVKAGSTVLDLTAADAVSATAAFADVVVADDVALTLTGSAGGTASVTLKMPNWTKSLTVKHKVTVNTKLPTAKLSAATLKLSSVFNWQTAQTKLSLSHANVKLDDVIITPTGKNAAQGAKINLSYQNGIITAALDETNLPAGGTYSFKVQPVVANEAQTKLKALTLKVTVAATAPTVKLTASTMKLNRVLAGAETVAVGVKITKGAGYTLAGFRWPEVSGMDFRFDDTSGKLNITLNENAVVGERTVMVYPILSDGTDTAELKGLKLKIQVYSKESVAISLTAKGKLDLMNPGTGITYSLKKLTGAVEPNWANHAELVGQDAGQFTLEVVNGKLLLKLNTEKDFSTAKTYKFQFKFNICGREIYTSHSVKVTQSKLKLNLPKTCTFYQGQTEPMTCTIRLTAPAGARLTEEGITINAKKSGAFLKAQGKAMVVDVAEDGRSAELTFDIRTPGRLIWGKSYAVYLDILPENCATNLTGKPTQVKMTVKVLP